MLKKYKWWMCWIGFTAFAVYYVIECLQYKDIPSYTILLQTGGIVMTLIAMFIIMLQTIYESNKSASAQIEIYQKESLKQIKAYEDESSKQIKHLQETTDLHIKALQEATARQLEHLTNLTDKHISAHKEESNKQMETVRNANKEQIQSFIEQTDEITSRLEEVAEQLAILSKLSGEMAKTEKELKEIEEEKLRLRGVELQKQQNELQVSVERIKPVISFMLEEKLDIIFYKVYLFLHNAGGDATSVRMNLTYKNPNSGKIKSHLYTYSNLKRGVVASFNTGRVRHLQGYSTIIMEISAWDTQQREYYANHIWDRQNNTWLTIDTKERTLLIGSQ